MKHSGTITLYNEYGTKLSEYRYSNLDQRKIMIMYWKSVLAEKCKRFYYHIQPDTHEEEIRKIA